MIVLNLNYKIKFETEEDLYKWANGITDDAQNDLSTVLIENKKVKRSFIDNDKTTERTMSILESVE